MRLENPKERERQVPTPAPPQLDSSAWWRCSIPPVFLRTQLQNGWKTSRETAFREGKRNWEEAGRWWSRGLADEVTFELRPERCEWARDVRSWWKGRQRQKGLVCLRSRRGPSSWRAVRACKNGATAGGRGGARLAAQWATVKIWSSVQEAFGKCLKLWAENSVVVLRDSPEKRTFL